MSYNRELPFWTRVEGALSSVRAIEWLIVKLHQRRKRWYIRRWHRQKRSRPDSLRNFELKRYSQFGEDGILLEIFRRIGEGSKFCVEFGIGDGSECCTRNLLVHHGWRGVLMEGSESQVRAARERYAPLPKVRIESRFITAENIVALFRELGVPGDFNLLSLDIDGNDYWVLEKILSEYRPRVMVVEYNGRWPPPKRWVMPYNPSYRWDVDGGVSVFFGASLASLADLADKNGYALVACAFVGANAFFVRKDELKGRFADAGEPASYHYAVPLYALGFGHPVRWVKR